MSNDELLAHGWKLPSPGAALRRFMKGSILPLPAAHFLKHGGTKEHRERGVAREFRTQSPGADREFARGAFPIRARGMGMDLSNSTSFSVFIGVFSVLPCLKTCVAVKGTPERRVNGRTT